LAENKNNMLTDYQKYRLYEILPGLSIWLTLLGGIFLSIVKPLWMIYFVLVFDTYWVLRVVYFSLYLLVSWRRFRKSLKTEWFVKLKKEFPDWERRKNVIIIPMATEPYEVLESTLDAFLTSTYPAEKMYLVISGEERKKENWDAVRKKIQENYTGKFADLICYTHPKDLPDEIPGKGSHTNYIEFEFQKYVDVKGWDYKDVIVSYFDSETVAHPQYFSHLAYMYCRHPRPERSSFQPVALYNNNIWESPSFLRIMAFGTTFWTLFSLARMDDLVTFSSHSMSFKAAMDVGGHDKKIVSEDSRIFYQCWLKYNTDYEVTPLYIPVSMDTVREDSFWKSLKNLYFQQRRWAWGVEHVPFLLWELRKYPQISRWKKFSVIFHEWEGKWSWAVVAIFISLLGRLPLWIAGEDIRQSALYFNLPYVLEVMMTMAMSGMFLSAILSFLILPALPKGQGKHKYLIMLGQWILLPVSLIFFSAIPCIDAVTHLMFGKYLGFNISIKKRKK